MDFFEAQARAKKRTSRLVALFAFAVIGTIAAGYFGTIFLTKSVPGKTVRYRDRYGHMRVEYLPDAQRDFSLWQPRTLAFVSLGTLVVVGLASLYKWNEFSGGGAAVAESVGGRKVDPHTTDLAERRLLNVVEEMALASGVPMPGVFILENEPAINAFAAGLTTSDAVVAVTRGTLDKLTRDELQGVVGHEFSHILNGDMRLNMRLTALVFGILVLGLAGRGLLWSLRYANISSSRDRDGKSSNNIIFVLGAIGVGLLVIGYVGYFFGRLIQAAVSRQREFLADASAVQFTRNPSGLGGALKKIGGLAVGSSLQSNKSGAIGHFFFAQSFRSNFGGLWATHPPLTERLRAIEPNFDGHFIEPPELVDVAHESFVTAGLVAPRRNQGPLPPQLETLNSKLEAAAASATASVGTLTPALLADAQDLMASFPPRLLSAAHSPDEAPFLVYGLLLDSNPDAQRKQLAFIASRSGGEARRILEELRSPLRNIGAAEKLPLLQLTLPALKSIPPSALGPFFETLDELVHADGRVSPFEFALQKLLLRELARSRSPAAPIVQIFSFQAVEAEISVVLSVLAYATSADPAAAFAVGAAQLKAIESRLSEPTTAADLAALDAALDRLASSSLPIKQRLLHAAVAVVLADGEVHIDEYELLRAIAATLDLPLPPLAKGA